MFGQGGFDFAQLDAEPAHFDLIVDAAQKIDFAGGAIANQIAGLVKARAGRTRKRIAHEPLCIEFRTIEIAMSQSVATDVKLAWNPYGRGIHRRVENVNRSVRD